jgi:hypothetical protein
MVYVGLAVTLSGRAKLRTPLQSKGASSATPSNADSSERLIVLRGIYVSRERLRPCYEVCSARFLIVLSMPEKISA